MDRTTTRTNRDWGEGSIPWRMAFSTKGCRRSAGQAVHDLRGDDLFEAQAVAQTSLLDFNIAREKLQIFAKGDLRMHGVVQRQTQQFTEGGKSLLRGPRVAPQQSGNGVERVEQKMRMQLRLERVQPRFGQLRLQGRRALLTFLGPAVEMNGLHEAHQAGIDEQVEQIERAGEKALPENKFSPHARPWRKHAPSPKSARQASVTPPKKAMPPPPLIAPGVLLVRSVILVRVVNELV